MPLSPSMRRAWIEMFSWLDSSQYTESPSMRRAWIEIKLNSKWQLDTKCRPPCGGRGLKYRCYCEKRGCERRPPCGGRGLKYDLPVCRTARGKSLSVRRAWIEIRYSPPPLEISACRSPFRERGLKCHRRSDES